MDVNLGMFEGRTVTAGGIKLTGSSWARVGRLDADEDCYLIVRATVTKITHGEAKIDGAGHYARVHTLAASAVELVDTDAGARMLDESRMLADECFGTPNIFARAGEWDEEDERDDDDEPPPGDPQTGEVL